MNSSEKRENKEVKRKREMAALKDSLLKRHPTEKDEGKNQYLDRSAIRRRLHPKSPPRTTTTHTIEQPLPKTAPRPEPVSSFAQNMMAAQGWAPGSGLGKDRDGRSEAVEVKMRVEKRGLGAKGAELPVEESIGEGDWRKKGKSRRFEEVREW
jgi:hypothetical protein